MARVKKAKTENQINNVEEVKDLEVLELEEVAQDIYVSLVAKDDFNYVGLYPIKLVKGVKKVINKDYFDTLVENIPSFKGCIDKGFIEVN